jgi:hypothetical protein
MHFVGGMMHAGAYPLIGGCISAGSSIGGGGSDVGAGANDAADSSGRAGHLQGQGYQVVSLHTHQGW